MCEAMKLFKKKNQFNDDKRVDLKEVGFTFVFIVIAVFLFFQFYITWINRVG